MRKFVQRITSIQKRSKSNERPLIAVIYYISKRQVEKINNWNDGFVGAIKIIEKDFDVQWINLAIHNPSKEDLQKFDFLIVKSCWDWIVDEYVRKLGKIGVKMGIMISCSKLPANKKNYDRYNVLWYETEWYGKKLMRTKGKLHAFGINKEIFKEKNIRKDIDVLSIGGFTAHKRFDTLKKKTDAVKVVIGAKTYEDSSAIVADLEASGIKCLDYVSQEILAEYINRSKLIYIPSRIDGGGERAVLEARACGVPVEVKMDNPKLIELTKSEVWDEIYYARQIKQGITASLGG